MANLAAQELLFEGVGLEPGKRRMLRQDKGKKVRDVQKEPSSVNPR
jgi:hypothetical protein